MKRTLTTMLAVFAAAAGSPRTRIAGAPAPPWIATWATAPAGVSGAPEQFTNETLRLIVHTSAGGEQVRVTISNTFGVEPLVIGAARVARRDKEAATVPGTDRPLTFGGSPTFAVPPGGLVLSDAVTMHVDALSDLAVSIYLPGTTTETTTHVTALQMNYVSQGGDHTGDVQFAAARSLTRWPFLTGVAVSGPSAAGTIVTFGDSITDGANSTPNTNHRWPDLLAARLQQRVELRRVSVIDEGIIGNRLLHATEPQFGNLFGPAGLARFDRDVLAQPGVRFLIVLLGINDIGHPGGSAPASDEVTAEQIAAAYRQLIERAHAGGIKVFGATLLPFEGTTLTRFYSAEKDKKREAVNAWIRTSGAFDAVIDFDRAVRDPSHPSRLLPAYDGGDRLHPSDAGMQAMANAIPLQLFEK